MILCDAYEENSCTFKLVPKFVYVRTTTVEHIEASQIRVVVVSVTKDHSHM